MNVGERRVDRRREVLFSLAFLARGQFLLEHPRDALFELKNQDIHLSLDCEVHVELCPVSH